MQFLDDVFVCALASIYSGIGGCDRARKLNEFLAENGRRDFIRGRVWTMNGEFKLILGDSFHSGRPIIRGE